MTAEEEILKAIEWQNKLVKAELVLLTEIKFELQVARKHAEIVYSIPTPPSMWQRFRYWVKGMINRA